MTKWLQLLGHRRRKVGGLENQRRRRIFEDRGFESPQEDFPGRRGRPRREDARGNLHQLPQPGLQLQG